MARTVTTEVATLGDLLLRSAADHPEQAAVVRRIVTSDEVRMRLLRVSENCVAMFSPVLRPWATSSLKSSSPLATSNTQSRGSTDGSE